MSIYIHYYPQIVNIMSGLFGSKPKDHVLDPNQVNQIAIEDWHRNNPNFNNAYGSSTTTFDGNQATVNQQFSPEMQGLFDQQTAFLGQGPQQLGSLDSPFFQGAIGNAMGSVYGRTGQSMPEKPMQGGQAPNPALSFGYDPNNLPTVNPPAANEPSMMQQAGGALQDYGRAQGGESPYYSMNNGLLPLFEALQKRQQHNPYEFEVSQ